jgi:hypothetical protein
VLIRGSCHCRNLVLALAWQPDPSEIPARACGCSFCTRHGAVWTAKPDGVLEIAIADPERMSRYSFGTRTAEFLVCTRCGGLPVATSEIGGRLYAVVNVNCFEDFPAERVRRAPARFDGEDEAARLARRQRGWIANVRFAQGA